MKSFIISHLKFVIIITCIATTIIIGILTFSVIKSKNNVSMQSNERNKDKIQIEVVADSVKIRESKEPNSQVIGNVYKNEIYSVISEDKESQYKWLEIETANGIKGYIVGIEAYVKKLETTIIIEEEQKPVDKPNIDKENTNNNEEKTIIKMKINLAIIKSQLTIVINLTTIVTSIKSQPIILINPTTIIT